MNIQTKIRATCKLFLQKKDIFLQKLVLDCLFPEKFLTLTIERKQATGINQSPQNKTTRSYPYD